MFEWPCCRGAEEWGGSARLKPCPSRGSAVKSIRGSSGKVVNDKFGHTVGDVYLRLIAARFRAQLRSTDTLARIGGDEFLVMTPHAEHFDPAEVLLRRLHSCFDEPFLIENECIEGSASFGLARYPEDGISVEELQRSVDHAMYAVKRNAAAALAS